MRSFNVFDEWGNYAGKFTPEGGGAEGLLFLVALFTIGLLIFAAYILVRMIFEGIKCLFKGDLIGALLFLSPVWLGIVLLIVLQIPARTEQNRIGSLQQEANWALANPDQAFLIQKIGPLTWKITNNLHQVVGEGTDISWCTAPQQDPPVLPQIQHFDIPPFRTGQSAMVTCDGYLANPQITLWSNEVDWTKVGIFCLNSPDYRCP